MTVETFLANFGHLADAPNGVQKLRELILQLAVQGKLVAQDPSDEPASSLVEIICAKNKTLKGLMPVDEPFVLPESWLWVRLGDISKIERGGSPRPIKDYLTNDPDGHNWIKIGDTDFGGKYISSTKEKIRKEGLKKTRRVYPGDFLLTNSMSFGRPYITNIEGCIHDGWLRIHPPEILEKNYLYNLLSSPFVVLFFKGAAAGAVVSNLNSDKVRELPIPIPPLEEQKRIVAKVDHLMALCDELEARQQKQQKGRVRLNNSALDALLTAREPDEFADHWQRISTNFNLLYDNPETIAKLRAAILQLAVQGKLVTQDPNDEPASVLLERIKVERRRLVKARALKGKTPDSGLSYGDIPEMTPASWMWTSLGELVTVMDAGWSPACAKGQTLDENTWGVLKTTAVQALDYLWYEHKELPSNLKPRPEYEVCAGDILITRAGPKNRVGICCLVKKTRKKLMISDKIIRFHLVDGLVFPDFYALCLNSGFSKDCVESQKSGMAESQMNISQPKLRSTPVPVPPLEEQKRIVAKVDQLMVLCNELEDGLIQVHQQSEMLMETSVRQLLGYTAPQKLQVARPSFKAVVQKPARKVREVYVDSTETNLPIAAETPAFYSGNIPIKILAHMHTGNDYSRSELLAATGISEADWTWAIRQLKEERKVAQFGEKRGARYQRRK